MDSTLSAYELQRLENIARNKEVLTSLGLAQAAPIAPVSKRIKPKAARPMSTRSVKDSEEKEKSRFIERSLLLSTRTARHRPKIA